MSWWNFNSRPSKESRIRSRRRGFRPLLEPLEDRTVLATKWDALTGALGTRLNDLSTSLVNTLASKQAALPILNQPLGSVSELMNTVASFKDKIVQTLIDKTPDLNKATNDQARDIIQTSLSDALGSFLGEHDGVAGINKYDVIVTGLDVAAGNVTIELHLVGSKTVDTQKFGFGLGLSGLPIDVQGKGQLAITAGFEYSNLKFGLKKNAFFIDTDAANELQATLTASIVNPSMSGVVGFLKMTAAPNGGLNGLTATMSFDVKGSAIVPLYIASATLGGAADVNLKLTGSFDSGLDGYKVPRIATDFQMHWDLNGSNLKATDSFGSEPIVNFNNVRVSLGEFLSNMLQPMVQDIQTAIQPLTPAMELLNARIPGVSEMSEAAGLGPVSLITLAKAANSLGTLPPDIQTEVQLGITIHELLSIVNDINSVDGNLFFTVGSFGLNGQSKDLRSLPSITNGATLQDYLRDNLSVGQALTALVPIAQDNLLKFSDLIDGINLPDATANKAFHDKMADFTNELKYKLAAINNGVKLEFPFIENPKQGVFRLLLGQDTDFARLTAQLHFTRKVSDYYDLFKVGPVQVQGILAGNVTIDANIVMGYDTRGLRDAFKALQFTPSMPNNTNPVSSLLNGFYIGTKNDLIRFSGGLSVGVAGKLPLFGFVNPLPGPDLAVTIGPEFTGGVQINDFYAKLNDPNLDGDFKFRVFKESGHNLFQAHGTLVGDLKADFVAHTPFPLLSDVVLYHKDIASHTLLDFSIGLYQANPFELPAGQTPDRTPAVIDLSYLPQGSDGIPNYITLSIKKHADGLDYYEVFFRNGLAGVDDPKSVGVVPIAPRLLDTISNITFLGGDDDDYITIQDSLLRDINIDARGGRNSLSLNSGTGAYKYIFTNGRIDETHTTDIVTYQGIDDVTLDARSSTGVAFEVNAVARGTSLTIFGATGGNGSAFIIGNGSLNNIRGNLALYGGDSYDTIVFKDKANTHQTTWQIADTGLHYISEGFGFSLVGGIDTRTHWVDSLDFDLTNIERVVIEGADEVSDPTKLNSKIGHRYEVLTTPTQVEITGGTGGDTYVIGSNTRGLNGPLSGIGEDLNLKITDVGGVDSLYVNDRGTFGQFGPGSVHTEYLYTVDSQYVMRDVSDTHEEYDYATDSFFDVTDTYHFQVKYANMESVTLYGGTVDASYALNGFIGQALNVFTGAANDSVTLGTPADGFSKFISTKFKKPSLPLLLQDLGGTDLLQVYDGNVYLDEGYVSEPQRLNANYLGFEKLLVNAPIGDSYVEVRGLGQNVSATIFGAGRVKVGAGTLANIKGALSIVTDSGDILPGQTYVGNLFTALTVDDTADPLATAFRIDTDSITAAHGGVNFFTLDFSGADLTSLALSAGAAGNQITLADTRLPAFTGPITLNTGIGADTVNIERSKVAVTVNGQNGADTVNVGQNGDMQGVAGSLMITNFGAYSTINLDDSADTTSRNVTMNVVGNLGTVVGLAPAIISYRRQDLRTMNVTGGKGINTFDVLNTAQSTIAGGSPTNLNPGSNGFATVNVLGTTGALVVNSQGNYNAIIVGGKPGSDGTLDNIRGDVTLQGPSGVHGNVVSILDRASALQYAYTMDGQRLFRTTLAGTAPTGSIYYGAMPMDRLYVFAANHGNLFQINGTPAADASVNVDTGDGSDAVTVFGAGSGQLNVDLGAWGGGADQSITIGDAAHSLDNVHSTVNITGDGPIDAVVSNEASTAAQVAKIGVGAGGVGQTFIREQLNGDHYDTLNTFSFSSLGEQYLTYRAGQGGDVTFVFGTPANSTTSLIGGTGFDAFWVETDQPACLGPVNVFADPTVGEYSYYYDYLNPDPQTYTVSSVPDPGGPDIEVVQRGSGAAPVTFFGLQQIIFYTPHVGGSTVDVQSLPLRMFLNMVNGPGDVVTLGREEVPGQGRTMQAIEGPVAIQGSGHITVTIDDSGDPTGRDVVVHPNVYPSWDSISGLNSQFIMQLDDSAFVSILGGQGDDTYKIEGNAFGPTIRIDGGGGMNSLDYSAVTDGVYVNLQTGEASGLKGGIANFQNATGGTGNDILVGNGANVLTGGAGRDILIAGGLGVTVGGADGSDVPIDVPILFPGSTLNGGADEDLLIGGATVYDTNKAALDALMAEWSGPELYSTRASTLQIGLLAAGKVSWNGLKNSLNGQAALDLLFGSLASDLYTTEVDEIFVGV